MSVESHIKKVLRTVEQNSPGQEEFYQTAHEVLYSLVPLLKDDERYDTFNILERITIPERTIIFKVS